MAGQLDPTPAEVTPAGPWDNLILELQALRRRSGDVSYQEIARRIREQRRESGASEAAAGVARSTVHATFALGRKRINLELVREIVVALGEESSLVDDWLTEPSQDAPPVEEAADEPAEQVAPPVAATRPQVAALLLGCLVLNLLGREFVDFLNLPIYLDMVGTAIAAIALGPWRGAAVGAATNIVGIIGSGWISLPFALVNITGALLWGYGVRRWGMGRTLPRFFTLNVLTAFACSMVAVPIIAIFLNGEFRTGHDIITELVSESIDSFVVALGFSNLLTSTGDKLVSGFTALTLIAALPLALRRGADLVGVETSGQSVK